MGKKSQLTNLSLTFLASLRSFRLQSLTSPVDYQEKETPLREKRAD
jgi:hypothetical protein